MLNDLGSQVHSCYLSCSQHDRGTFYRHAQPSLKQGALLCSESNQYCALMGVALLMYCRL
jgi:hypothetical protein